MHQPMSALPLIATAKADMYPANGQSAFPPGWLLMSALSARGGASGFLTKKYLSGTCKYVSSRWGRSILPPRVAHGGKVIRALHRQDPERKLEGFLLTQMPRATSLSGVKRTTSIRQRFCRSIFTAPVLD